MNRLLNLLIICMASLAQAEDPSEKTDLADAEPDRAADMLKRLKSWYADTQKNATPQLGGWLEVAE